MWIHCPIVQRISSPWLAESVYASSRETTNAAPDAAPDDVPEVTITKETEQTVEEYRIGGKLYMIKITPKHGVPYYLVDDLGDGKFVRQESLDSGLRVPRWIIHKF